MSILSNERLAELIATASKLLAHDFHAALAELQERRSAAHGDEVEKVGEAIFLASGRAMDVAWKDADKVLTILGPDGPQKVSEHFRAIARAAIAAMPARAEVVEQCAKIAEAEMAKEKAVRARGDTELSGVAMANIISVYIRALGDKANGR